MCSHHGVFQGCLHIAGSLAHHAKQLTQVAHALGQRGLEFGQDPFVLVIFDSQAVTAGVLIRQFLACLGQQAGLLIAFANKTGFALLVDARFGSGRFTDAAGQFIKCLCRSGYADNKS